MVSKIPYQAQINSRQLTEYEKTPISPLKDLETIHAPFSTSVRSGDEVNISSINKAYERLKKFLEDLQNGSN